MPDKTIQEAISGDKKARGKIYKLYQRRVLKFILQRVQVLEDAEEILQETFLSSFQALPYYANKSSLLTWILGICKHEMADFYRKRKIKTIVFSLFPVLEGFVSQALGPEKILEKKQLQERVKKVLSLLREGYAVVLRLKYIQGLTVKQIAQKLGQTQKAIESKLSRARKAFGYLYVRLYHQNQTRGKVFF
ncbi:RNA polymerase sigma factor [Patescibacteria group bacterium]